MSGLAPTTRKAVTSMTSTTKFHIGSVLVCPVTTNNPFGNSLMGQPRRDALKAFKAGTHPADLQLWGTSRHSGTRRIQASDVDWSAVRP